MSDKRNNDLESIIAHIFPMKCNTVYAEKKQVIIGAGKYANKCSFRETDKEYYINLFKYTFAIDGTEFIANGHNSNCRFNRQTAVDNAIKYLNKIGIIINCTLYCDSEKTLLARYIFQIFEKILSVMFSFGKNFDEEKYTKLFNETAKYYYREIVTKGIISLIYTNAGWSDVELNKKNEDSNDCLLIDNGADWRKYYGICHVDTGLKLQINSNMDTFFHSGITYQCDKFFYLQNKPVSIREDAFCYLDFFHLDHEYYVPNHFCYCTDLKSKIGENEYETDKTIEYDNVKEDDELYSLAKEYVYSNTERGYAEFNQAMMYLRKVYCSDRKKQYMSNFSIITNIISILLRINYREFYSDDFSFSKTAFEIGFKQLIYYFEDHRLNYTKREASIIYRYLLTQWIDTLCNHLELFNFEELFDLYCDKDKGKDREYADCIEKNRTKINCFKSLEVLSVADAHFNSFCVRNRTLIDEFNSEIVYDVYKSFEKMIAMYQHKEYSPFKKLKESIRDFQKKLDWNVPYYLRITVVDGKTERSYAEQLQGYGHVGDKKTIKLIQDEKYTIEGSDSIKLGFNKNIAEIKYILKAEYVSEQMDKTITHDKIDNVDTRVILKKNCKYRIEFEAYGTSNLPFSFIIIRRTKNKTFETVFDKDDIELSSEYKTYSFEFTYNGENEEPCYFAFGYGNIADTYCIRYLNVSEIE